MVGQPNDKPYFVIMAGLSGSGKTTLARNLGAILGWPVVSKDLFKSALIKARAGMINEETGRIAYELLFAQAEDLIVQQGFSLIFDTAAHREFILKNALHIAHQADAEVKILYCTTSGNERLKRLEERAAAGLHHSFMLSTETTAIENDAEHFRHLPDDRLVIYTQEPLELCLQEALSYILTPKLPEGMASKSPQRYSKG